MFGSYFVRAWSAIPAMLGTLLLVYQSPLMGSNDVLFLNQKTPPNQGNIEFLSTSSFFARIPSVLMLPPNMPSPVCVRVNVDAYNDLDVGRWGIRPIR